MTRGVLIVDDDRFIRKLIATTLDMPGLNGIDACRRPREDVATSGAKPFSPLDLLRLVDELGEHGQL